MQDPRIPWKQFEAPGGLISVAYDEPPAFGSHTLHFTYQPTGGSPIALGQFELNNDGVVLSDSNLVPHYGPDQTLYLTLHGQQQADQKLVFYPGETPRLVRGE
jgi:hypothetical protein